MGYNKRSEENSFQKDLNFIRVDTYLLKLFSVSREKVEREQFFKIIVKEVLLNIKIDQNARAQILYPAHK